MRLVKAVGAFLDSNNALTFARTFGRLAICSWASTFRHSNDFIIQFDFGSEAVVPRTSPFPEMARARIREAIEYDVRSFLQKYKANFPANLLEATNNQVSSPLTMLFVSFSILT